jgi:4-hydroxybenzoate polyprenyltransferase
MRWMPAAGATTSRSSIRRTRRGICRTSSSGAASRRSSRGKGSAQRCSPSRSRSASALTRSTSCALVALVPVGLFLVLAYNLELLGGRFHSDLWFGLAWGGFPVVCGYAAVAGNLDVAALLGAAFAVLLSLAQRTLSNHVRYVRRRVAGVEGSLELRDGSTSKLDADALIAAEETGLRLLAATSIVLAAALVAFRI